MAWRWRLIANSLPRSLPWLRVLQVTQCARSFGEGAARDRGEIFPARGQTEMHLINVWIVLAILLGLLAVTRLLRYDDVSHYEVFSDGESVGRIAEPERGRRNAQTTYRMRRGSPIRCPDQRETDRGCRDDVARG